jgi:hypothetical protein
VKRKKVVGTAEQEGCYVRGDGALLEAMIQLLRAYSSRPPDSASGGHFLHLDGGIRSSRASGSSFFPGFRP